MAPFPDAIGAPMDSAVARAAIGYAQSTESPSVFNPRPGDVPRERNASGITVLELAAARGRWGD